MNQQFIEFILNGNFLDGTQTHCSMEILTLTNLDWPIQRLNLNNKKKETKSKKFKVKSVDQFTRIIA